MSGNDPLSRDKEWLLKQDRDDIDPEIFSEWVTRVWADGVSENDARLYVLQRYDASN